MKLLLVIAFLAVIAPAFAYFCNPFDKAEYERYSRVCSKDKCNRPNMGVYEKMNCKRLSSSICKRLTCEQCLKDAETNEDLYDCAHKTHDCYEYKSDLVGLGNGEECTDDQECGSLRCSHNRWSSGKSCSPGQRFNSKDLPETDMVFCNDYSNDDSTATEEEAPEEAAEEAVEEAVEEADDDGSEETPVDEKKTGTFEIFTGGQYDQFYFRLKANNGQIILASEGYTTKTAAKAGIQSVTRHSADPDNFRKFTESSQGKKKYYFVLKAGNHEPIGKSQMYTSSQGCNNGIKSVTKHAANPAIVDLC